MPYVIQKQGRIYFLKKKDSNTIISRHTSKAKAQAAIRAIEASKHKK